MSKSLLAAAEVGDSAGVLARLDAGDDIEFRAKGTGRTAVLEAVIAGQVDAVKVLCERGADVGAACKAVGNNALTWAASGTTNGLDPSTSLALVNVLLAHGADPNAVPDSSFIGHTALMRAAQAGDAAVVARLVEAGADLDACNRQGDNALSIVTRNAEQSRRNCEIDRAEQNARMAALLESMGATLPTPGPPPSSIPWPDIAWERAIL